VGGAASSEYVFNLPPIFRGGGKKRKRRKGFVPYFLFREGKKKGKEGKRGERSIAPTNLLRSMVCLEKRKKREKKKRGGLGTAPLTKNFIYHPLRKGVDAISRKNSFSQSLTALGRKKRRGEREGGGGKSRAHISIS